MMNKNYLRKILYCLFIIGLISFVIAEITRPAEIQFKSPGNVSYPEKIYYIKDGQKIEYKNSEHQVNYPKGVPFSIETVVPINADYGFCICLRSSQQDIKFFIDGKLRSEYNTKASRSGGKNSQSGYAFCQLRQGDGGKPVRIETLSYTYFSGFVNPVMFGTQSQVWGTLIKRNLFEAITAMVMLLMGLSSIIIGMIIRIKYKRDQIIEASGWVVMLGSLISLTESQIRQLFLPNFSAMAEYTYYNVPLLMMSILIFVDMLQEKRYHKTYAVCFMVLLVNMIIEEILYHLQLIEALNYLWVTIALLLVALVFVLINTIKDAANFHTKKYAGIIWSMVIFLAFALTGNILVNYSRTMTSLGIFLSVGLFFPLYESVKITFLSILEIENEQKIAIYQKKAREQFFASVSHEIRTPLNGVLGLNELILKKATDPEIKEYSQKIHVSGELLHSVISDLLDFSKAEANKLSLSLMPYEIQKLFATTFDLFEENARKKGLEVEYDISEKIPRKLEGDEYRITQILTNLLSNAIKYTETGKISIKAESLKLTEEIVMLCISVSDTGQGIKPENIDKLFNTFERFEESKNRAIQGTGLGLAITKQLVDLMRGTIEVKSEYGKGSTFTINIPQKILDEQESGNFIENRKKLRQQFTDTEVIKTQGKTALAVDDNEVNLVVIESLLKQGNLDVTITQSGQEAIELCQKKKYDIIFMDHIMPGIDGVETTHQIQTDHNSKNKDTFIVALTANEHPGIKQEYIEKGFSDYLSKPIKISDLNNILAKFV